MKGKPAVLETLNKLLTGELSSADQYFIHSRMYQDWGLGELFTRVEHEREEELQHAARLIERILFLEGMPDVGSREALNIGRTVPEMIRSDLDYELAVVDQLRTAISLCETEQDFVTRGILVDLLQNTEEDHAYWLEQQLGLIDKMGLENYLEMKSGA